MEQISSDMMAPIKLVLGSEVKRFQCGSAEKNSAFFMPYYALEAEIRSAFPALRDISFSVKWTDDEGDNVTICRDSEVREALSTMLSMGSVIRFTIWRTESGSTESTVIAEKPIANSPIHQGVTCNVCNVSPICGVRYRCTYSENHDLCETCESQRTGPLYPLIKVSDPSLVTLELLDALHDATVRAKKDSLVDTPCISTSNRASSNVFDEAKFGTMVEPQSLLELQTVVSTTVDDTHVDTHIDTHMDVDMDTNLGPHLVTVPEHDSEDTTLSSAMDKINLSVVVTRSEPTAGNTSSSEDVTAMNTSLLSCGLTRQEYVSAAQKKAMDDQAAVKAIQQRKLERSGGGGGASAVASSVKVYNRSSNNNCRINSSSAAPAVTCATPVVKPAVQSAAMRFYGQVDEDETQLTVESDSDNDDDGRSVINSWKDEESSDAVSLKHEKAKAGKLHEVEGDSWNSTVDVSTLPVPPQLVVPSLPFSATAVIQCGSRRRPQSPPPPIDKRTTRATSSHVSSASHVVVVKSTKHSLHQGEEEEEEEEEEEQRRTVSTITATLDVFEVVTAEEESRRALEPPVGKIYNDVPDNVAVVDVHGGVWRAELQLLAAMGFEDRDAIIPLLETHLNHAGGAAGGGANDHDEALQRVIDALLG